MAGTSNAAPGPSTICNPPQISKPVGWRNEIRIVWSGDKGLRDGMQRLVIIHRNFYVNVQDPNAYFGAKLKAWIKLGQSTAWKMNRRIIEYIAPKTREHYERYGNDNVTQFVPFRVVIPRITVHNYEAKEGPNYLKDVEKYFNQTVPRQIGTHTFISFYGELSLVNTEIDSNGKYTCEHGKLRQISALYPVIRYGWLESPKTIDFVYGLEYKSGNPNDNLGIRYYHRNNDEVVNYGNAKEITFGFFRGSSLADRMIREYKDNECFGLYVCAGARLVVTDQLNTKTTKKDTVDSQTSHNRDLYQQGGVVFVNGPLRLCFNQRKILNPENNEEIIPNDKPKDKGYPDHPFGYPHFSCEQFSGFFKDTKLNTDSLDLLKTATKPILFLGAIDSNFQTISWSLNVMAYGVDMKQRIGFLEVPENARITAIADGEEAAYEVRTRLLYERLMNSVVIVEIDESKYFRPTRDAMIKMLDPGETRVLEVDSQYIGRDQNTDPKTDVNPPKPLYREHNTSRFSQILKISPYFVAPMYPPLYKDDTLFYYGKQVEHYYPIQLKRDAQNNPILDPMRQVYTGMGDFDKNHTQFKFTYELHRKKVDEYQWKIHNTNYPYPPDVPDGRYDEYRVGVDGWLWKKTSVNPVVKIDTLCYVEKSKTFVGWSNPIK